MNRLASLDEAEPTLIRIEQPAGTLEIRLHIHGELTVPEPDIVSAGLIRTARKLFKGVVLLPNEASAAA